MSSNSNNTIVNKSDSYKGLFASSVEYNGGEGKDNYVAEIRASGTNATSNGHNGSIDLVLFHINANGGRSQTGSYKTTVNNNSYVGANYRYTQRCYDQELTAIFEVAAGDADGDGIDEVYVYSGAYEDVSGIRYAIVDVYHGLGGGKLEQVSPIKLNAGPASYYTQETAWQVLVEQIPVVTITTGDFERNGTEEVAMTVSAPTGHQKVAEVARTYVYGCTESYKQALEEIEITKANKGVVTTEITRYKFNLKKLKGLDGLSMAASDGKAMVSANCTFGAFDAGNGGYRNVLIVAGYQSNNQTSARNSGYYTKGALRFIYYDEEKDTFVASPYYRKLARIPHPTGYSMID